MAGGARLAWQARLMEAAFNAILTHVSAYGKQVEKYEVALRPCTAGKHRTRPPKRGVGGGGDRHRAPGLRYVRRYYECIPPSSLTPRGEPAVGCR